MAEKKQRKKKQKRDFSKIDPNGRILEKFNRYDKVIHDEPLTEMEIIIKNGSIKGRKI